MPPCHSCCARQYENLEYAYCKVALNAELARNFLGDPGGGAGLSTFVGAYRGSEALPLYPPIPGLPGIAGAAGGQLGAGYAGMGGMPSASGGFLGPAAAVAQSEPPPAVGVPMDNSMAFPEPITAATAAPVKLEPTIAASAAAPAHQPLSQPLPSGMSQPPAGGPATQPHAGQPPDLATELAHGSLPVGGSASAAEPVAMQHPLPAPSVPGPADDVKPQVSAPVAPPSTAAEVGTYTAAAETAMPYITAPTAGPSTAAVHPQQQLPDGSLSTAPCSSPAMLLWDGKGDAPPATTGPSLDDDGVCGAEPPEKAGNGPEVSTAPLVPLVPAQSSPPLANGGAGVPLPLPTSPPAFTQNQQLRSAPKGPKAEPKAEPKAGPVDGHADNGACADPQPHEQPGPSAAAAPAVRVSGTGRPVRSPKGRKLSSAVKSAKPVAAGSGQESKR